MIPNISRGSQMAGLLTYLVGEGRHNEHEDQHLVAGDDTVIALYGRGQLDRPAAVAIARTLELPQRTFGTEVTRVVRTTDPATGEAVVGRVPAGVWHCSLSLAAEEGKLSDERWAEIAGDFIDRMGYSGTEGRAACRWVAVRHGASSAGNDHVHLAVSLVREDGTKASTHNDFRRAQDACRELEHRYGLVSLESRERGLGERGVKPGERERAAREGAVEIDAHRLERAVRAAATASRTEGEFLGELRSGGVIVRPRFAAGRSDTVIGYSVAVRPVAGKAPVWFGGGRLARDLTLPRLREGWAVGGSSAGAWRSAADEPQGRRPVPGGDRGGPGMSEQTWSRCVHDLDRLRADLRSVPLGDRAGWAHAARDAAGVFAAWSAREESAPGPLAHTSRMLARSAHVPAHLSAARPVGLSSIATAAALLLRTPSGQGAALEAELLRQLARVAVAILDMHTARGDATRAEQLRSVVVHQIGAVRETLPAPRSQGNTTTAAVGQQRGIPSSTSRGTEGTLGRSRSADDGYGR